MFDGETCTLGAINLNQFVVNNRFNYDGYRHTIHTAVRFLDLVIDKTLIPDDAMREKTMAFRRIGLGVMGLATLLDRLQIKYESEEALVLSDALASCLTTEASRASQLLGQERGYHRHSTQRRHISVTCLQPTGGIRRLVANDGFSIEPRFDEATKISPQFSVRMAATWQRSIENAVSKTVNLASDATVDDILSIYKHAFYYGCKGITVYRDGCRENQPIALARCHDGECRE
jgi:ribonucleoside-diphosphate reductase alpha chain